MNNTDKLRALLTLNADMSEYDIEIQFHIIARKLFQQFAIQAGDRLYLFKEIEFYFYNRHHRDIITHPRVSQPLCWYVNDFGGIDLNFASKIDAESRTDNKGKTSKKYILDDNAYFGGILLRQLISADGSEVLNGPWACAEIFRIHDATGQDSDFPKLIEHDNGIVSYIRQERVKLLSSKPTEENIKKKVDNILWSYHEFPEKEVLYTDFSNYIDKQYKYDRQLTAPR